jgi:hypothetical protein
VLLLQCGHHVVELLLLSEVCWLSPGEGERVGRGQGKK